MGQTTYSGPVRSMNGFVGVGPGSVVNIPDGTNTLTLDPALHAGRILTVNDASLVLTLPAISAVADDSPSTLNNQGNSYYIFIETTSTAFKLSTNGTDKYVGSLLMVDTDTAGAATGYAPAAANDNINFNGTTTGGLAGTWIKVTALKSLKWLVEGVVLGSGVVATPFADA